MKKNAILMSLLLLTCCFMLYGDPVQVPDPVLEAAIETVVGDNGMKGEVDGAWLLGRDSVRGVYAGRPGGLSVLGAEGENLFALQGVADLTGLEYAKHLTTLTLKSSPVASLSPLLALENLHTLAFDSCRIHNRHLEELLDASFSLSVFALINNADNDVLNNRVDAESVYALLARHPELQRLALVNLGIDIAPAQLSGTPQFSDPPCGKEYHLSGNHVVSLAGLSLLNDVVLLELSRCMITDAVLAQGDWGKLGCLAQALNLSANAITDITPLMELTAVRRLPETENRGAPVLLDLRKNRLDRKSIDQHIPELEAAGWDTRFNMELLLTTEGRGDLPAAAAGSSWHEYGNMVFCNAQPRPDSDQGFVGWRGDIVSDDYSVTVDMTAHRALTAVFSKTPAPGRTFYGVTVDVAGDGSGVLFPECGRSLYRDGEMVGLVATPDTGSYFGGWEILYEASKGAAPERRFVYTPFEAVKMEGNVAATACFKAVGHTLTLALAGNGELSLAPGRYPLVDGATITVHALPADGWRLKHWTDEADTVLFAPAPGEDTSLKLTLEKDRTVQAVFEEAVCKLTVQVDAVSDASGTVYIDGKPDILTKRYMPGDTATLVAAPANREAAFYGWSGDLPQDLPEEALLKNTLVVSMEEARNLTARFVPAETHLTVEAMVDGLIVDDMKHGLEPLPGVYGFVRHPQRTVELEAFMVPGRLAAFAGWRGDLQEKTWSPEFREVISMERDRKVAAIFQTEQTCRITLAIKGAGTIMPAPGRYAVVPGRRVNLEAHPHAGMSFGGWHIYQEEELSRVSLLQSQSLEVGEDIQITACFGPPAHTLWIGASEVGGVLTPVEGMYSVPDGALVDLDAEPPAGRMFYHWTDSTGKVVSRERETRVEITEDTAYTAVFGNPGYRVHIEPSGTGSGEIAVSPQTSGIYPQGSTLELMARPDSDSVFLHWEGLPNTVETADHSITLTVTEDMFLKAVFGRAECQLTVISEGLEPDMAGIIRPEPGVYGYLKGAEAVCFAAPPPDSGYAFAGWESDGVQRIQPESRFPMTGDRQVSARFVPLNAVESVTLTVQPCQGAEHGRLAPLPPGRYHFCKDVCIDFYCELQPESFFDGFIGDYAADINYHGLTVVLDKDRHIGAQFSRSGAVLILGLNGTDGGTIIPSPGVYRLGHTINVLLQAVRTDARWTFTGWFDGSDSLVSPYGRYRFRMPRDKSEMRVVALFQYHPDTLPMEFCMQSCSWKNIVE